MIASSIPTYLIFIMWKKKPKLFDEFIGMFDANSIRLHGLGQETALLRIFFIFSIQAPRSQLGAIGGIGAPNFQTKLLLPSKYSEVYLKITNNSTKAKLISKYACALRCNILLDCIV